MNRWAFLSVAAMLAALSVGCKSKSSSVSGAMNPEFKALYEKQIKMNENGALAAVAQGSSALPQNAIDKAKLRARAEIATTLKTKIEALQKVFNEDVGEGKGAELNALFSSAIKSITSETLSGTTMGGVATEIKDGQVMACVLMVQNPKILANAMEQADQSPNKAMYTRFRASQAFKEMDEEIKKYEEFKSKQGGM